MGQTILLIAVPDDYIKSSSVKDFNVEEYLMKELGKPIPGVDLPYFEELISFGTNKGWQPTQEVLDYTPSEVIWDNFVFFGRGT